MTRPDLATILIGHREPVVEPPDDRTECTLRCPCGTRIATINATNTGRTAWVAPRTYTRLHTATMLLDQALDDFEVLFERAEAGEDQALNAAEVTVALLDAADPGMLARVVPPLRLGGRIRQLDPIAQAVRTERARAAASNVVPNHIAGLDTSCGSCRRVWYVGEHLASWVELEPSERPSVVIVDVAPRMRAHVIGWPASGLRSRVALYRNLTGVLRSESTTA